MTALSKYAPASIREVFSISFPMMLAALSGNFMLLLDRLMLAHYSTDAMNAVATVGIIAILFVYTGLSITAIAEVFVGQYNGAKEHQKVARPVWQMIWFSVIYALPLLLLASFAGPFLISDAHEYHGLMYFKILMTFGVAQPLYGALTSFFVGRGQVRLVTLSALIANILNLVLDYALIFGIEGWVPSLGATGAGIATAVSIVTQALILGVAFVSRNNREKYASLDWTFRPKLFWKCIKIGAPNAIGRMFDMGAWAFLFHLLTLRGPEHITLQTIGQSIFVFFAFFSDGMEKGVISVASNLIGEKKLELIPKLLRSSFVVHSAAVLLTGLPLLLNPELLLNLFLVEQATTLDLQTMRTYGTVTLFGVWMYITFDGAVWIFAGVLTSGGDTRFIMMANAVGVWLFAILPIYIFTYLKGGGPAQPWIFIGMYAIVHFLVFFWRYRTEKWKKLGLAEGAYD